MMMRKRNLTISTEIITEITTLRERIKNLKKQGQIIGFVPTMGALHAGHESLIKKASEECDKVVVSIFVNPVQFGPNEDYDKYPRQLEQDKEICSRNKVDIIFLPSVQEMYPEKDFTTVVPPLSYQDQLCGKSRPGHFNGVATVVLKLFNIVQPDKSYFGQKDAQQLIIIKKMVRDLNLSTEITGCPIIREESGLALSSRNAYLSEQDKLKALTLSKVLYKIKQDYKLGEISSDKLINDALILLHPDIELEYLKILDALTMLEIRNPKETTLVAIAGKIGNIRLIDNLLI